MLVRLDLLGLVSDNTHELANERISPYPEHHVRQLLGFLENWQAVSVVCTID